MSNAPKSTGNSDALLCVEELASLAGVSKSTVRRLVKAGELSAVRINRLVRVRISDWQAYLESHRTQARPLPLPTPRPRAASEGARPVRPH
jgi:excisionase family DNA binding protein